MLLPVANVSLITSLFIKFQTRPYDPITCLTAIKGCNDCAMPMADKNRLFSEC